MLNNDDKIKKLAKVCAVMAVRNTSLENIHAGQSPGSNEGDYSDVKVICPAGEFPWNEVSHISQEEMKVLMKQVVNRLYTILTVLGEKGDSQAFRDFMDFGLRSAAEWDEPQIDEKMMPTIDYRTGEKYK